MPKPHFISIKAKSDEWVEPGHQNCFLMMARWFRFAPRVSTRVSRTASTALGTAVGRIAEYLSILYKF